MVAAPVMAAVSAVLVRRGPAGLALPPGLPLLLVLLLLLMLRVTTPGDEPSLLREGEPSADEGGLEPPCRSSLSSLVVAVILLC